MGMKYLCWLSPTMMFSSYGNEMSAASASCTSKLGQKIQVGTNDLDRLDIYV